MARLKPFAAVVPSSTPAAPKQLAAPTLRWPSHWWESSPRPAIDRHRFPDKNELGYRSSAEGILASVEFFEALQNAQKLLIMDNHFDGQFGVEPMLKHLKTKTLAVVKIISCRVSKAELPTLQSQLHAGLQKCLPNNVTPDVQWRNVIPAGIEHHDRFAIVDDELWHFGATVGGCHPSINAFSRGWSANETRAEDYFFHLWGEQ